MKSLKSWLLFITLCILTYTLVIYSATAETSVNLGGVSTHLISRDTTTSFHRAVVVNHNDYLAGYLKNSYGNDSFVAGYRVFDHYADSLQTDIHLGVVRGYDKCYGKFSDKEGGKSKIIACPLVIISTTIDTGTRIKPTISLWGDALVLTAKYNF